MLRSLFYIAGFILLIQNNPCYSQQAFTRLSMQEATNLALKNHPDVKNANIDMVITKSQKNIIFDFSPTRFSYSHGQLNSSAIDWMWTIDQDFGSVLAPVYKNQKNRAEQKLYETKLTLTKKEILTQTKIFYNAWIYYHHKLNLLSREKTFFSDLVRVAALQFELGETTLLEKTETETGTARLTAQYQQTQSLLENAENQLQQFIMVDDDLIPETEELILYEIHKPPVNDSLNIHARYYKQKMEINQSAVNLEKSKLFPSLHAGYFNHQIDKQAGFYGWQAGISIPLWFFPQKHYINQAKLEAAKASNQYEYQQYRLQKEKELLQNELNRYFSQIQFYKNHLLKQAELLMNTATSQYKNESISYTEYLDNIEKSFEIQLEYLDVLKSYNETAIKLEYYAY